jgi:ligand-binding SRPBCC domain-containing protein
MGIEYESVVEHPVADVFAWHARLGAMTRLVPPWQASTTCSTCITAPSAALGHRFRPSTITDALAHELGHY